MTQSEMNAVKYLMNHIWEEAYVAGRMKLYAPVLGGKLEDEIKENQAARDRHVESLLNISCLKVDEEKE